MSYQAIKISLVVAIASSCTTSEHRESAFLGEHRQPDSTEPPPRPCHVAIADAQAAIALAAEAKRAANFLDEREVDGPKALVAEGFRLSPMFPPQWPPVDCAVVFYVFEMSWFRADSVRDRREPAAARVTVRLDTGKAELAMLTDAPGYGGWLQYGGGGQLAAGRQQWVFDAVANSMVPKTPADLLAYKEWLSAEQSVAPAVFVWHREFFDFVVGDDTEMLREVEANAGTRTHDTGRHSTSGLPQPNLR